MVNGTPKLPELRAMSLRRLSRLTTSGRHLGGAGPRPDGVSRTCPALARLGGVAEPCVRGGFGAGEREAWDILVDETDVYVDDC